MAHALSMRATSMGASALLVGIALIAALTATYRVADHPIAEGRPAIDIFTPPPPTPPTHTLPPSAPVQPITPDATPFPTIDALPLTPNEPATGTISVTTGPIEITHPYWSRVPSDLQRFYPRRALARGQEGRALLDCQVSVTGALDPCVVVSETPSGWGFGAAAQRIAREYSMQPATLNGLPAPGRYRMNVPFAIR